MSEVVGSPIFTIKYNGKDISKNINQYLKRITYTDTVEGEASELCIVVEDVDGFWKNGWYPTKGSTLTGDIGGLDFGQLIIADVELSGPPDIVEIKAQSSLSDVPKLDTAEKAALAGIKKKVRTKRSKGHENKTLLQIAQSTAAHNGLTIQGNVPNINIGRVSQHNETDLRFLRRLSYDYGVIFRVQGGKLVYITLKDVEKKAYALVLDKSDLERYKIKDKTFETYSRVKVKCHNQKLKGVIAVVSDINNRDGISYPQITAGDTYVTYRRVDNDGQAQAIANALLYRKNTETQTGSFKTPGRISLIAGNNVRLTGLGAAGSGDYSMRKVTHVVEPGDGWYCDVEIKRVSGVLPEPKPKSESQPSNVEWSDVKDAANAYKWSGANNLAR